MHLNQILLHQTIEEYRDTWVQVYRGRGRDTRATLSYQRIAYLSGA